MTTKLHLGHARFALLALAVLAAIAFTTYAGFQARDAEAAGLSGGVVASDCDITSSVIAIGNQASTQLFGTSSRRAWARVEQPINATNTVSLMGNDKAAVAGQGFTQLTQATTTSPNLAAVFGLNTDMPYTGAVKAITNSASSSVLATQCVY